MSTDQQLKEQKQQNRRAKEQRQRAKREAWKRKRRAKKRGFLRTFRHETKKRARRAGYVTAQTLLPKSVRGFLRRTILPRRGAG